METVTTASEFQVHLGLPSIETFQQRLKTEGKIAAKRKLASITYVLEPQAEWFRPDHPELGIYPLRLLSWMQAQLRETELFQTDLMLVVVSRYSVTNPKTGRLVPWELKASFRNNHDDMTIPHALSRVELSRDNRHVTITPQTLEIFSADKSVDLERWVLSPDPQGVARTWKLDFKREQRVVMTTCPPTRHAAMQRLHRIVSDGLGLGWEEAFSRYWHNTYIMQELKEKRATPDQAKMLVEATEFFKRPYTRVQLLRLINDFQLRENYEGIRRIKLPFIKLIDGVECYLAEEEISEERHKDTLNKFDNEVTRGSSLERTGPHPQEGEGGLRQRVEEGVNAITHYYVRRYKPLVEDEEPALV